MSGNLPKVPSLGRLRKVAKAGTAPGIDAAVGSAGLLILAHVAVGLAAGAGLGTLVIASVGVPTGMFLASALVAGVLEVSAGRNLDHVAWPAVVLCTAPVWWWLFGAGWAAAAMAVAGVGSFAWLLGTARRRRRGQLEAGGLPADVVERLLRLPRKLPPSVRSAIDEALAARASIRAVAGGELATERAVDIAGLENDADACLRQIVGRIDGWVQQGGLRPSRPGGAEVAALVEQVRQMTQVLARAHDAAAGYAAAARVDAVRELAARSEHLERVAQGMRELDAASEVDQGVV